MLSKNTRKGFFDSEDIRITVIVKKLECQALTELTTSDCLCAARVWYLSKATSHYNTQTALRTSPVQEN